MAHSPSWVAYDHFWRTVLVVPLDLDSPSIWFLSLIPTYLSEVDTYHANIVCRHWRKILLQHAILNLSLRRTNSFIQTRLERAKGSPLDITSSYLRRADTLVLLSPHAQEFRSLNFIYDKWSAIQRFSDAVSGPLPLFYTLEILAADDGIEKVNPPPHPPSSAVP